MAELGEIVDVVITRASAQVSRASFGVPLIAASHSHWAERVRSYSAISMLATMEAEGFAVTDAAYVAARAMLSQSPRPSRIKIGRVDGTWNQQVTLTPTLGSTGDVFSGRVNDQPWQYTQLVTDDLADLCTAIAAEIDALTGVTATGASGTTVVISTTAALTNVDVLRDGSVGVYSIADTTAATNLASGLSAIRAVDSTWYGLVIDRLSEAANNAAATYAETQRVLFCADSFDSGIVDAAVTTDIASDVATLKRTSVWAHKDASARMGAAMLALILPYDPGSANWAHKSPAGVRDPGVTTGEQDAALAKRANILVTAAGLTDTQWGTSGTDFLDNVQGEDWVTATLQEDVYAFLRSAPKIPYTNRSVARLVEVIRAVLNLGVERGVIADDTPIVIEAPDVADVSPVDRANRLLPDVYFSFRLSGAINTVSLTGLVSL